MLLPADDNPNSGAFEHRISLNVHIMKGLPGKTSTSEQTDLDICSYWPTRKAVTLEVVAQGEREIDVIQLKINLYEVQLRHVCAN